MHDERWKIWIAVIAFLVFIRLVRGAFRAMTGAAAKSSSKDGMARLNAAAERILKERSGSGGNPLPRTGTSTGTASAQPKPRTQVYNAKGSVKSKTNPV